MQRPPSAAFCCSNASLRRDQSCIILRETNPKNCRGSPPRIKSLQGQESGPSGKRVSFARFFFMRE